ncbi:MAG: replicative DNA helicase, partial [Oceanisphaera sp.]|nr:replicative DNA helicase [Oceanisphaera sp.]
AVVREMISVANEIAEAGFDPQGRDSTALLDLAETKVFKIAESRTNANEGPQPLRVLLEKTIDRIEELYKNPHQGITGVSSGYSDLDKKTAGFQSSDLIIVAARPSMGKTTFAMNLCEHAALTSDKPVLIFSLEMPSEQIIMRMLASLGRIDQTRIRTGQLDDEDWARLSSTMGMLLEKGQLYIDDSSGLTPTEVRSRARRVAREHGGISMIMIDYLQLMTVPSLSDNRTLEIAEISRSLKSLAKELKVPVIALSQLNRSLEQRADKRPVNSDLRESGSIEQDADLIMFIYRDEVYHDDSPEKGIAEIIIGKQRNGPIGRVRLTFQGQFSRFDNYAGPDFDDEY